MDARAAGRPLAIVNCSEHATSARATWVLFDAFRLKRPVLGVELAWFGRREDPPALSRALASALDSFAITEPPDVITLNRGGDLAARIAAEDPGSMRSLAMFAPWRFESPSFWKVRLSLDRDLDAPYRAVRVPVLAIAGASDDLSRARAMDPDGRWTLAKLASDDDLGSLSDVEALLESFWSTRGQRAA